MGSHFRDKLFPNRINSDSKHVVGNETREATNLQNRNIIKVIEVGKETRKNAMNI